MPATSYPGLGTQVFIAAPTTTYQRVGQVTQFTGPGATMGTRDITNLDSPAKEFAAAIGDGGELSGEILYNPSDAGQGVFQTLTTVASTAGHAVNGAVPFKVVLPTTTKLFTFLAIPTAFSIKGAAPEGSFMADFSAKITGAVTWPST